MGQKQHLVASVMVASAKLPTESSLTALSWTFQSIADVMLGQPRMSNFSNSWQPASKIVLPAI